MKRFNWKSSQAMSLNLEVQKSSSRETYVKGKHIYSMVNLLKCDHHHQLVNKYSNGLQGVPILWPIT